MLAAMLRRCVESSREPSAGQSAKALSTRMRRIAQHKRPCGGIAIETAIAGAVVRVI
jgi:hypothetical protein